MNYVGDFPFGHTLVVIPFPTHKGDGTPITLAGTPAVTIYKDNTTTKSTTGVTLTVDLDSVTGSHVVKVDTSQDATFYAAGHDFVAKLSAGTVDGITVVGYIVGSFSVENRSALRPTVAGRTLDVAATGEAGIDLTNKLDTTGILPSAQAGASSGLSIVGSKMDLVDSPNVTGLAAIVAAIWDKALTGIAATGSIGKLIKDYLDAAISSRSTYAGGAVASVTAGVTVTTNNDKGGYSLSTAPPTAADIKTAIEGSEVLAMAADLPGEAPTVEAIDAQLSGVHGAGAWGTVAVTEHHAPAADDPILDENGDPIQGAEIYAYSDSDYGTLVAKATTDANGLWDLYFAAAGTYYIRCVMAGYEALEWEEIVT